MVEKAVESLGISKAAVKTNTGTKTATVTHLAKVKPDRRLAVVRRLEMGGTRLITTCKNLYIIMVR